MKYFLLLLSCFVFFSSCAQTDKAVDNSNNNSAQQEKEQKISEQDKELIGLGVNVDKGVPTGLKVGANAPNFVAKDKDGQTVELEKLLTQGPVVLNFYRGVWCPVCNRYMSEFQESMGEIESLGAQVVSITPEKAEKIDDFIEKTNTTATILVDGDASIMKAYDVLFDVTEKYQRKIRTFLRTDIAEHNAQEEAQLPVPATYIIGQDGKISYVQFDTNYKNRATVEEIVSALKNLK